MKPLCVECRYCWTFIHRPFSTGKYRNLMTQKLPRYCRLLRKELPHDCNLRCYLDIPPEEYARVQKENDGLVQGIGVLANVRVQEIERGEEGIATDRQAIDRLLTDAAIHARPAFRAILSAIESCDPVVPRGSAEFIKWYTGLVQAILHDAATEVCEHAFRLRPTIEPRYNMAVEDLSLSGAEYDGMGVLHAGHLYCFLHYAFTATPAKPEDAELWRVRFTQLAGSCDAKY